jgi:hypothetical protein
MAKRKGALAKDPKKEAGPTFKHEQNKAAYASINERQQARYRKILANKGRKAANQFLGKASGKAVTLPGQKPPPPGPTGPANEPAPGTPFEQLTPEQQGQEMGDVGGQVFTQMGGYAQQFDPRTFQQEYETGFNQEMDRYRQNVMSQFERRNQRQFEQQRLATQQQIAERGLDPASPAAQELMRQQNEREDLARQEAMSSAEQGAYGIQQQAFGQARETALMPGQIAGQFIDPAMLGYQQAGAMNLAQQQTQAAMEQQRLQGRQRLQEIRATPRGGGGGGGGGMDPFQQYMLQQTMSRYDQGTPQPNLGAQIVGGAVQGATGQITGNLNRR